MILFLPLVPPSPLASPSPQTAAKVAEEQIKADDDTSVQQRLLLGTGTALGGVAEIVGEENEIAGGMCVCVCVCVCVRVRVCVSWKWSAKFSPRNDLKVAFGY